MCNSGYTTRVRSADVNQRDISSDQASSPQASHNNPSRDCFHRATGRTPTGHYTTHDPRKSLSIRGMTQLVSPSTTGHSIEYDSHRESFTHNQSRDYDYSMHSHNSTHQCWCINIHSILCFHITVKHFTQIRFKHRNHTNQIVI